MCMVVGHVACDFWQVSPLRVGLDEARHMQIPLSRAVRGSLHQANVCRHF